MKQFFLRLFYFGFILFLICLLLDVFISKKIRQIPIISHGEYSVWNDLYGGKVNSDMVINGSSRAWAHIDPLLLTAAFNISCYNLGIDGQSFPLQYFRYEELIRFNKRPKIIIHSLDIFTFTKHQELYNYEQFLPYMLFDLNIWKAIHQYAGFTVWDFAIPGLRYMGNQRLIDEAFKFYNETDFCKEERIKGYRGQDLPWNNDLRIAKSKMGSYIIDIDNSIVESFEKYLTECLEHKTKVVLVYSPEYIEGQKFVKNRDTLLGLFKNISMNFHIPFYNYSSDSISYQRKYFYNATHLNKVGSQLFTRELITDIRKDTTLNLN